MFLVPDDSIIRYCDYVRQKSEALALPFFDHFMAYFQGMTKQGDDDFAVTDEDFVDIFNPDGPSLVSMLEEHILRTNPSTTS